MKVNRKIYEKASFWKLFRAIVLRSILYLILMASLFFVLEVVPELKLYEEYNSRPFASMDIRYRDYNGIQIEWEHLRDMIPYLVTALFFWIPSWCCSYRLYGGSVEKKKPLLVYLALSCIVPVVFYVFKLISSLFFLAYFAIFLLVGRFRINGGRINWYRGVFRLLLPIMILSCNNYMTPEFVAGPFAILGLIVSLVFELRVVILIVFGVVWFLRSRSKRGSAEQKQVFNGTFLSLHDFYVCVPFRKGIPYKKLRKSLQKLPRMKLFANCSSADKMGDCLLLYYEPQYVKWIAPQDAGELADSIIRELQTWRGQGKEIIVICDETAYKDIDRAQWDELTRRLNSSGFSVRFDCVLGDEYVQPQAENRSEESGAAQAAAPETLTEKVADAEQTAQMKSKLSYIRMQMEECDRTTDSAQAFYGLIKTAEYVFHYRGLVALSREDLAPKQLPGFSMGDWIAVQGTKAMNRKQRGSNSYEVGEAMAVALRAVKKDPGNNKSYNYSQISEMLVQLRNLYIGHGTMAYSVSKELLDAVRVLVECVINRFENDGFYLEANLTSIVESLCDGKYIPCMVYENGREYMLSFLSLEGGMQADYINYQTGDIVTRGVSRRISLCRNEEVRSYGFQNKA